MRSKGPAPIAWSARAAALALLLGRLLSPSTTTASPLLLDAARIAAGTAWIEYPRQPGGTEVIRLGGLSLDRAGGIELRLESRSPTQLRVFLALAPDDTRVRHVTLSPEALATTLRLDLAAFDPVPGQTWSQVPPGGALVIADVPGLRLTSVQGRLGVGPLRLLESVPPAPAAPPPTPAPGSLEDRILGGWLGKVAGGDLGMPSEGRSQPDWAAVEAALSLPASAPVTFPTGFGFGPDDDTTLGVSGLFLAERLGRIPGALEIASSWRARTSPEFLWVNEWSATLALLRGARPPATAEGPFGETLTARIRVEPWAFLLPGSPAEASAQATRDASIETRGTGTEDAAFWAAALSAAFREPDLAACLDLAARIAPGRYAGTLLAAFRSRASGTPLRESWEALARDHFEPLRTAHTKECWVFSLPNAGLLGLALAWGGGDFRTTLRLAASLGWDSDCNAATLGAFLGVRVGASGLPPEVAPQLEDRLRIAISGEEHQSIRALAARTATLARRLAGLRGAETHPTLTSAPAAVHGR